LALLALPGLAIAACQPECAALIFGLGPELQGLSWTLMSGFLGAGVNAASYAILYLGTSWTQIAEAGVFGFFAGPATAGIGLAAIAAESLGWAATGGPSSI
jgi:hypothetical protein